jgi:hypothetical protein
LSQTRQHLPSTFARTPQTRRHSPKAIFEKNINHLAKFTRVMRESGECGASGHCLSKTLFKWLGARLSVQIHNNVSSSFRRQKTWLLDKQQWCLRGHSNNTWHFRGEEGLSKVSPNITWGRGRLAKNITWQFLLVHVISLIKVNQS